MSEAIAGRTCDVDAVSRAFVDARRAARPLASFPGAMPASIDEAYEIQRASIDAWDDAVAGWKIGMAASPFKETLGVDRMAGAVFARGVRRAQDGERVTMGVYEGGFAAVEAELVLRLREDAAVNEPLETLEDAAALVSAMHVGVEIASSPLGAINDLGPLAVASDFGNNAGLIVGPEIPNWRSLSLKDTRVRVSVDGEKVGDATADTIPGGPLAALKFLVDASAAQELPLSGGAWVSTGAITGVHEADPGATALVDFGPYGAFEVVLEAFSRS